MTVERIKRLAAVAAAVLMAIAVAAVLAAGGLALVRSSRGADPATALTEVAELAPGLDGVVRWMPDAPLQRRAIEPATRRSLEAAWTRAWAALVDAEAGDPSKLEAWFSGPALEQLRALADRGGSPDLVVGAHELHVTFYSDDGSVVGLRAHSATSVRVVETAAGPVAVTIVDAYDAVMILEDGNWRVRQWRRDASGGTP